MVKALFDAGVPIVTGTDGALPGFSVLRSIEMFRGRRPDSDAGDPVSDERARNLDGIVQGLRTIEAGKRADLVVLDADPLADIRNIRKLRWVVANGRVMEPAGLWRAAGFK